MEFIEKIEEFNFNIQEETFYFEIKNLKKEFLGSNLSIISVNKNNNINFFSSFSRSSIF